MVSPLPAMRSHGGSHGGGEPAAIAADDYDHCGIPRQSIDPVSYMMTAGDDGGDDSGGDGGGDGDGGSLSLDSGGQLSATQAISGGGAAAVTLPLARGGEGGARIHCRVDLVRLWDLSDAMRGQVSWV